MNSNESEINNEEKTKKCTKCDSIKILSEFHRSKDNKDGYNNICKICKNVYSKGYYINNIEKRREYRENNYEILKKYSENYFYNNKEYYKSHSKEYYNQPLIKTKKQRYAKEYNKEWVKNNYEKRKKYNSDYIRRKYNIDIEFTLGRLLRNRLNNALKNEFKHGKTLELLGCSIEKFKHHLEKQFDENMNWKNRGIYWEIDHIKPIALYNLTNIEQQKECFHYTNLQPLERIANRKKGSKQLIY